MAARVRQALARSRGVIRRLPGELWSTLEPYWQIVRLLPGVSWPLCVVVLMGTLIGAVLPVAFAIATGVLVGALPAAAQEGPGSSAAGGALWALLALGLLFLASRTVDDMRNALGEALGRRLDVALQQRLMRVVLRPHGVAHLEDRETQDRIFQVTEGLATGWWTPGLVVAPLANFVSTWLQIIGALALVGVYRWWLALLLLGSWVVCAHVFRRQFLLNTKASNLQQSLLRRAAYLRRLVLLPAAAKEIRLWGMLDWTIRRFRAEWLERMVPLWRERGQGEWPVAGASLGFCAVQLGAYVYIGACAVRGEIDLAWLTVLVAAIGRIDPAAGLGSDAIRLAHGPAALPALGDLERAATEAEGPAAAALREPRDAECAEPAAVRAGTLRKETAAAKPAVSPGITFDRISFRYPGQPVPLLGDFTLHIPPGRSLAIVGLNGAGKTTLVKLLCRLYEPDGGRILVDSVDLRTIEPREWQHRVAAVFQDFARYQLSARDNVAFGGVRAAGAGGPCERSRVVDAARKAGVLDVVEALPWGWETVLSREFERGTDLSGGQWQRIALARALYAVDAGACVLILDEPTASLDVRAEAELFERFLEITAGLTTILISHRFSTVRRANRICVLEHGVVSEIGTHDELLAAGGRYAEMFRLQASRFTDTDEGAGTSVAEGALVDGD